MYILQIASPFSDICNPPPHVNRYLMKYVRVQLIIKYISVVPATSQLRYLASHYIKECTIHIYVLIQ
jgi:hypothetical protein